MMIAAVFAVLLLPVTASADLCNDPFDCNGRSETDPAPKHTGKNVLTAQQAKIETRRRAVVEASGWTYPNKTLISFASKCTRKGTRRINCGFSIYQIGSCCPNDPAPPRGQQKSCRYINHVSLTKRSKRPTSAMENLGCVWH